MLPGNSLSANPAVPTIWGLTILRTCSHFQGEPTMLYKCLISVFVLVLALSFVGVGFAQTEADKTPTVTTPTIPPADPNNPSGLSQKDQIGYSLGVTIGKSMKQDGIEVNSDLFLQGLNDALAGAKLRLTDKEITAAMTALQNSVMEKQAEAAKKAAEENKKVGDAFLAENKTKPGVVTLPSGLQYKIIKAGTGPKPKATDKVECHYRGTLINGTEFDSSYKRGQPATFPVNGVIKGWTEALQLMPVGSKWELFIPADLAYGTRGAGPQIGPNTTLIFEVELLGIK
jgi:FKBP-type peptidyl-prolyl cis-trans isomerase